ncbi:bacterial NAD-glutamate dehydrogenase family protein, partial [Vibrio harveyi]
RVLGSCS